MANDLNIVTLIGRLTKDPELKSIASGTSLCKFSIANNRSYTVQGEKREEVNFFNCSIWGKRAEVLAQYARKGAQMAVTGRLVQRTWDGKDKKLSAVEIAVEEFQFLSRARTASGSSTETPAQDGHAGEEYPDDDIPF